MQEKKDKEIRVMLQPTLYKIFKRSCGENYKTISEVIRDMILEYTQKTKTPYKKALNKDDNI